MAVRAFIALALAASLSAAPGGRFLDAVRPPVDLIRREKKIALVVEFEEKMPGLAPEAIHALRDACADRIRRTLLNDGAVVEGSKATEGLPLVVLHIDRLTTPDIPSKGKVIAGQMVASTVNTLIDLLTTKQSTNDAGSNGSSSHPLQDRNNDQAYVDSLGYTPLLPKGTLTFQFEGKARHCGIAPDDILFKLGSIPPKAGEDHSEAIRQEEARVLADRIYSRLASNQGWGKAHLIALKDAPAQPVEPKPSEPSPAMPPVPTPAPVQPAPVEPAAPAVEPPQAK